MATINWKNVNAQDNRGIAQLSAAGAKTLNKGLSGISDAATKFQLDRELATEQQNDEKTQALINTISQFGSADLAQAKSEGMLDPLNLRKNVGTAKNVAKIFGALNQQESTIKTGQGDALTKQVKADNDKFMVGLAGVNTVADVPSTLNADGSTTSATTGLDTLRDNIINDPKLSDSEKNGRIAAIDKKYMQVVTDKLTSASNERDIAQDNADLAKTQAETEAITAKANKAAKATGYSDEVRVDGSIPSSWNAPQVEYSNASTKSINTLYGTRDRVSNLLTGDLIEHAAGWSSLLGLSKITPEGRSATSMFDQVLGKGFLANVAEMKGLGSLSNAEGSKVTSAWTALVDPDTNQMRTGLDEKQTEKELNRLVNSMYNLEALAQFGETHGRSPTAKEGRAIIKEAKEQRKADENKAPTFTNTGNDATNYSLEELQRLVEAE